MEQCDRYHTTGKHERKIFNEHVLLAISKVLRVQFVGKVMVNNQWRNGAVWGP